MVLPISFPNVDLYQGVVRFENNFFTEMCSGSEAGSYLRLIDLVHHSTLGLRVINKKGRTPKWSYLARFQTSICTRELSDQGNFSLRIDFLKQSFTNRFSENEVSRIDHLTRIGESTSKPWWRVQSGRNSFSSYPLNVHWRSSESGIPSPI